MGPDSDLPYLVGPFEFVVQKISTFASGHFSRIAVHSWNTRSGFEIGDKDVGQTFDCSFHFGQFGK